MRRAIALAGLPGAMLLATASGCFGGGSAVKHRPIQPMFHYTPPQTPAESRAHAASARAEWLHEIRARGRRGKQHRSPLRFPSPEKRVFLARLHHAGQRYRFTVDQVRFYRPLQLAPFIVLLSDHPEELSRDTRAIVGLLDQTDPKRPNRYPQLEWKYEGFYLEARDARGNPFLAVFNFIRGPDWGGGQWAQRESLYPYEHG